MTLPASQSSRFLIDDHGIIRTPGTQSKMVAVFNGNTETLHMAYGYDIPNVKTTEKCLELLTQLEADGSPCAQLKALIRRKTSEDVGPYIDSKLITYGKNLGVPPLTVSTLWVDYHFPAEDVR